MSNYEKGEQIKSVEEFVKEVLAKDKAYYCGDALYKNDIDLYYCINGEMWEECFHAIPKKEKKKFYLFAAKHGECTKYFMSEDMQTCIYEGKEKPVNGCKIGWTKTNCFIEVEV